jgi:hypothetical protein
MLSKKANFLFGALLGMFAFIILLKGVWPAFNNTRGDFGNYYTASRLLVEGISLETAYRDFIWFQKQMDRYGIENQLGGFIPHPPPTALLFLPLTPFDALTAKKIWILFNVGLVVLNIFLLSKISGLNWLITAVLFLGTGYGLLNNFLFGQQYLLLLTSILAGIYLFKIGHPIWAGIFLGSLIPMKYVGMVFLLYFLWKKQWRLVLAAVGSGVAVLALTLLLGDLQSFQTFFTEVLPRHLRGEIQEPFAIYFQSWNSLLRRLFLYEVTLNPNPPLAAPLLFFLFKNLVFWTLLGFTIFILGRVHFQKQNHQFLFHLGFIPLAVLLISPGSATYHFLLLTISVVFFVKILLEQGKVKAAVASGLLFIVINLPHYMKLKSLATGWLTPLGYTRLWFLLAFFLFIIFLFKNYVDWNLNRSFKLASVTILAIGIFTVRGYSSHLGQIQDGAKWLKVDHPEFNRHLGLILKAPNLGSRDLVFTYCELMDEDYAVYSADGGPWTPQGPRNYYQSDLAPDDTTLLVETVVQGRTEIWWSRKRGQSPTFLVTGEHPSWHPDGLHFAFVRDGKIYLSDTQEKRSLNINSSQNYYDVAFSPKGNFLAYCAQEEEGTSLRIFNLQTNQEETVLSSAARMASPAWSPDEEKIVFSWNKFQNRDIWVLKLPNRKLRRLTFHRAADDEPVWDAANQRIIFTSDRGRGLECSTLYWLPVPEELAN